MSVGGPRTGIFSGNSAGSGAGLAAGAIVLADLVLLGLDTIAGYLRRPPATTTDPKAPDVVNPHDIGGSGNGVKGLDLPITGPQPVGLGTITSSLGGLAFSSAAAITSSSLEGFSQVASTGRWARKGFGNPAVWTICSVAALGFSVLEYTLTYGATDPYDVFASAAIVCIVALGFVLSVPH